LLFGFDLVSPRNDYYLNMDGSHGYGPGTVRVDFGLDTLGDPGCMEKSATEA